MKGDHMRFERRANIVTNLIIGPRISDSEDGMLLRSSKVA